MLTEETKGPTGQEQTNESNNVIEIHNDPVMQSALDALSVIGKYKEIKIRARGNSIPNAVAVANILTDNMLKGNSKITKITVDSEPIQEMGRSQSNIEIIIQKF
jgi:DNA-binding protein